MTLEGECLAKCPKGYREDPALTDLKEGDFHGLCIECEDSNCAECSETHCKQCADNYYLFTDENGFTTCVEQCPKENFYGDESIKNNYQCKAC